MLLEALGTDETALLTSLNVSLFCYTKSAILLIVLMIPAPWTPWIEDPGPSAWTGIYAFQSLVL